VTATVDPTAIPADDTSLTACRVIPLVTGWTVRWAAGDAAPDNVRRRRFPAEVPGCVHTALLRAGLIDEPYVDSGWLKSAWIGRCDWVYERIFDLEGHASTGGVDVLVFHGVDTVAVVHLNGREVGRCQNMHRPHRLDITGQLQLTGNLLTVHIAAPLAECERLAASQSDRPIAMPGIGQYNRLRKMACGFGWDWAPPLNPVGLWGGVELQRGDPRAIESVSVRVTDGSTDSCAVVKLGVILRCVADASDRPLKLRAVLHEPDGEQVADVAADVDTVEDAIALTLDVSEPRWWFPRGYGEQPLYGLRVELIEADTGLLVNRWHRDIGLRRVRIDRSGDDVGSAFRVCVNDRTVFCLGYNWVPGDTLLSRNDEARMNARIDDAIGCGVNMLRVWGGGVYESEAFYDRCDRDGILVWQDFAFACAMYDEDALADEVRREAEHQVARLAWRPSLVLWCGGNECVWFHRSQNGWAERVGRCGWGEGFYGRLLPSVIDRVDPGRPYVANSPMGASLAEPADDVRHGPQHLWDAWNREPAEAFLRFRPRFASEFGFCSAASPRTLREAMPATPEGQLREAVWARLLATNGRSKLEARLAEVFGERVNRPQAAGGPDFEVWCVLTQAMQARAMELAVTWFRSLWPHCAGALVWQLQDSWPAVSWSVVDYAGRRKLAWYALRRAMKPTRLAVVPNDQGRLDVVAINQADGVWNCRATVRAYDKSGSLLCEDRLTLIAPSRSVTRTPWPGRSLASIPGGGLLVADAADQRYVWSNPDPHPTLVEPPRFALEDLHHGAWRLTAHDLMRDVALADAQGELMITPCIEQGFTLLPGESMLIQAHHDSPTLTPPPRVLGAWWA
jgi:beta-mannosidase